MEIRTFATIDAPAAEVWEVLADFASYPRWNRMIPKVSGHAEVGARLTLWLALGPVKAPVSAEVIAADPGRSLRWIGPAPRWARRVASGEHYHELTALTPTSTRIEHGETFRGLLVPARAAAVEARLRPVYEAFNRALAREVAARAAAA